MRCLVNERALKTSSPSHTRPASPSLLEILAGQFSPEAPSSVNVVLGIALRGAIECPGFGGVVLAPLNGNLEARVQFPVVPWLSFALSCHPTPSTGCAPDPSMERGVLVRSARTEGEKLLLWPVNYNP
ncbi:unnamed protein product [Darwinula stevensoni]|uniref:Uncharacterized protein n=1 Tax=Darwinula stevensoni TaxID=69355 RepID=A0A7R9FR72_9CRUS|nr:unnamed protein product [Darwinula stevensoni]CAG0900454.1 unnamed protein product [Darwinula stevensoni]